MSGISTSPGRPGTGEEAIKVAMELRPDVIVMDINMPGMDGVAAAEIISQRLPTSPIIMMSVHGEATQLKRAISAGAREFLVKPFSGDEFSASIRTVFEREIARRGQVEASLPTVTAPVSLSDDGEHQVIAVFSPKGGAGRTTIATNLAVALHRETGASVCLVDANLQFGDVGVLLNLNPKDKSIADAVETGDPDGDIVDTCVIDHSTGIRVLLAPPSPEGADMVTPQHMRSIIDHLRIGNEYVVIDLPSGLSDHLPVGHGRGRHHPGAVRTGDHDHQERTALPGSGRAARVRPLQDRLVINRADAAQGIRIADVEASVRRPIDGTIVSDGRLSVLAVNRGVPFVVSHPDGPLSRDVAKLARTLAGDAGAAVDKTNKRGLFARR